MTLTSYLQNRYTRAVCILTLTSLAVYLWYLRSPSVYFTDNGPFLPQQVYLLAASLVLLTLAFSLSCVVGTCPRWLMLAQWVFLATWLFLTPYLVTGAPRYRIAYLSYGYVEYILRHGKIGPGEIWYHSWPGFPLLFALVSRVLGSVSPEAFIAVFPIASMMGYAILAWVIVARVAESEAHRWTILWMLVLASWTDQAYFSPQGLAYFLFLLLLMPLVNPSRSARVNAILVVSYLSLAITHLLTAFAAGLSLVALSFIRLKRTTLLVVSAIALGVAWQIYGLRGAVLSDVTGIVRDNLSLDAYQRFLVIGRFVMTSGVRQAIVTIRTLFSLILLFLTFAAILTKSYGKRTVYDPFFLCVLVVPALVIFLPYGGEILTRVFLLGLLPMAYFLGWLLSQRWYVLTTLVLWPAFVFLHVVAHYGGDSYEAVRPGEVQASRFVYARMDSGELIALPPPLFAEKQEVFSQNNPFKPPDIYMSRGRSSSYDPKYLAQDPPTFLRRYVILGPAFRAMFAYSVGAPEMIEVVETWLATSPSYDRVYASGSSVIWASNGGLASLR